MFRNKGSATKLLEIVMYIFKFFELPLNMIDKETISIILWLQNWYKNECDEYWEHLYGIQGEMNETKDVFIQIDLDETIWEEKAFESILKCKKIESKFVINCQFSELIDNLTVFKKWIEAE